MANPTITLSSKPLMIEDESEWERWKQHIHENLDEACNFTVDVDYYVLNGGPSEDQIRCDSVEQEQTIREAVRRLRGDFCGA